MIKFLEMREKLKATHYAALCIYGNDAWLKRKSIANVCDAYGIVDDGFSVDRLESPTLESIRFACFTPSMFCSTKLVVCENFVFSEGPSKLADTKKQIADIIRQSDGSFCLVFVSDTDKHFADISGMETVDCNRLDKGNVVRWIVAYGKQNKVAIDNISADRIATYCLLDMARVSIETQKLIDYGSVSIEAIDALVHKDAEYAVYDLSSAIAAKNAARALEIYRGLVARGEDNRALFALIYNFYRRVYYVKTSSLEPAALATALGVKQGAVSFARDTAAKYKAMQLKRALDYLAQADERLKAFVDEGEVMNILIMQLVAL